MNVFINPQFNIHPFPELSIVVIKFDLHKKLNYYVLPVLT